jgi:hypothetical protein
MNREIADIVAWALANGWRVEDDKSGYTRFYDSEGNYITSYPATPSNPYRRMMDLKTNLKRAGLQIPPPSKKQQRSERRKEAGQ